MKQYVNDPAGYATNLRLRQGTNLTLINQGIVANIAIGGATEAANTVTIVVDRPHGLKPGDAVTVGGGILAAGYAGVWTVLTVPTAFSYTYTNPTAGLAASTAAGTSTQGCDVYFDTSAIASRLNTSLPGTVPDGSRIAAGGGQVQFTNAPIIWLRAQLQTFLEIQP